MHGGGGHVGDGVKVRELSGLFIHTSICVKRPHYYSSFTVLRAIVCCYPYENTEGNIFFYKIEC